MSKYSPEQLSTMGNIVMADHKYMGHKSLQLIVALATLLDLEPTEVMRRVRRFTQ